MMGEVDKRRANALAECVATPENVTRTALRILLLVMHRGLYRSPATVRKSPEARRASAAMFACGDFLHHRYDCQQLEEELGRLSDSLIGLAVKHDCDPFYLLLYALGDLPWRRRQKCAAQPLRP